MLNQSSPVAKTAFDSLQAKQSAVSVGYDPIVVRNQEVYRQFLQEATTEWKTKRQTPLVNAGYAARVLAISHAIHSFVAYHQHRQSNRIQLVFLGCGADVIGLWAHSLEPSKVTVLELDTPEVCSIKRDLWIRKHFVDPVSSSSNEEDSGRLVGRIRSREHLEAGNIQPNYALCPIDLRDISQLNNVVQEYMDLNAPTLAVSELVLAYLAPTETEELLSWCSSHLCISPGSSIVALEPLGYESSSSNVISVMEGYKREYCQQFGCKMERGKSLHNKEKKTEQSSFHPVGMSYRDVATRFEQAGFEKGHSVSLGVAAAHAMPSKSFVVPEIFDEHAALTFHLKSYTVVCGFSKGTEALLRRIMCPSEFASTEIQPLLTPKVVYTVIEATDEIPVRTLFSNTYCHFLEQYPAIRKMARGAMDGDLSIATHKEKDSVIGGRYKSFGGCFLVAIRYEKGERQVVGCVGIRQCERKDNPKTLEVFRLSVDANHRGKGIGRTLLNRVELFALSQGSPKVIANTLTILESAMRLYEACGYTAEKDTSLGTLDLRTYVKQLPTQHIC
jgi:O-methyltransferase involved in polyketide biosynthesis/GNAT superfamily N-acetyltransferase